MADAASFVRTWADSTLREQQGAQSHFNDLCQLVGQPTPSEADPHGEFFTFEKHVTKANGKAGRADVWYRGRFALEYKGKDKDLDAAYQQLLSYKTDLENPPLLVVCDFDEYRIYPQWTNTNAEPFVFHNADLLRPTTQRYITWLLTDPNEFLEERKRESGERAQITEALAKDFAKLADQLRAYERDGQPVWAPLQIARFLTRLVFSLFAEDIGLLPRIGAESVFHYLVQQARRDSDSFAPTLQELFQAMNGDKQYFLARKIPHFNGGLFAASKPGARDGTEVLDLSNEAVTAGALETLEKVASADWRKVNPTIFGTLFEAALDAGKRAQLGAHYTSEADIRLIVEPVLMAPLQREWAAIQAAAEPVMQRWLESEAQPNAHHAAAEQLTTLHDQFLKRLGEVRVLDPACGSGNFLYVSLKALKDLESHVHRYFARLNLPFADVVTPRQLFGIEKDPFAAKLAHVVVWIGYLQWRYEDAGVLTAVSHVPQHKREIRTPILNDKTKAGASRILNDDAILRYAADGQPYEPEWPAADVIMGNPPFLGSRKLRAELGDKYVNDLNRLYSARLNGLTPDLSCYWFEKSRRQIAVKSAGRVGLISTNSIRGGSNRVVLTKIKETGDMFLAWSDRQWILAGAAVRISVVGFDDGSDQAHILDGVSVPTINSDLTAGVPIAEAKLLVENKKLAFQGVIARGPFNIDESLASKMIADANADPGFENKRVIRKIVNARDITSRTNTTFIIDFGANMPLETARKYKIPFQHLEEKVKPVREKTKQVQSQQIWWRFWNPRPEMRKALVSLERFIVTPTVSKHRLFVWQPKEILADHQLIVFARDDDYFFGVLHSYINECWSLRMGTWLGKGNDPRYTPTTTFETFPFPWAPGTEPTADPRVLSISAAAKALNEERALWLNPPDLTGASLSKRTLTNLYNALEKYRQLQAAGSPWLVSDADPATKFAPRLAALHTALDAAVLAAYGWPELATALRTAAGDEELLRRLLALNGERAGHKNDHR